MFWHQSLFFYLTFIFLKLKNVVYLSRIAPPSPYGLALLGLIQEEGLNLLTEFLKGQNHKHQNVDSIGLNCENNVRSISPEDKQRWRKHD